jgi:signal transduction histidine kinase
VSDNVPVARPPGAMTAAVPAAAPAVVAAAPAPRIPSRTGPETDVWDVEQWHWRMYFAVVATVVATFVVVVPGFGDGRWLGLGLLGAIVLWFVLVGRRAAAEARESWLGWVFLAGQLALFTAALAAVDIVSLLLFGICPLTYMIVRVRRAHVAVALYAFAPAAVSLIQEGPASLLFAVPLGVVVTTISVVTAVTTSRSERISEERAALIRELEATRAEVARLSHEAGVAAERQRLAGDIHDTVAQGLSSVVMLLEAADGILDRDPIVARDHLRLATRTARENLDETRAIVAALTPLHGAPLADALHRLVDRFAAETGTSVALSTVGQVRPLGTGREVVLLRVVQEALHNVRKHSGAATVSVELAVHDDTAWVQVRDDGAGFDTGGVNGGYGLGGMRARVEQVGGVLTISSAPGQGTTIRTEVPL